MDFFKAGMMGRRYGLHYAYDVKVVGAYAVLASRYDMGWTVIVTIVVDGAEIQAAHWYTHMTNAQATKLVAAVKTRTTFDAGMWRHV